MYAQAGEGEDGNQRTSPPAGVPESPFSSSPAPSEQRRDVLCLVQPSRSH